MKAILVFLALSLSLMTAYSQKDENPTENEKNNLIKLMLGEPVVVYSDNDSNCRFINNYDAENRILQSLTEVLHNGKWNMSSRVTYYYDSDGYLLTEVGESWQNNNWLNSYKRTYSKDLFGNKISYTYAIWENGKWIISSVNTFDVNSYLKRYNFPSEY
ncbi:MAG: hypothetical protein WCT77_04240 [Bacteroidota bacterium]